MASGFLHSLCMQTQFLLSLLPCLSILFSFGNLILPVTLFFLFIDAAFSSKSHFLPCCGSKSSADCHQIMTGTSATITGYSVKLSWLPWLEHLQRNYISCSIQVILRHKFLSAFFKLFPPQPALLCWVLFRLVHVEENYHRTKEFPG